MRTFSRRGFGLGTARLRLCRSVVNTGLSLIFASYLSCSAATQDTPSTLVDPVVVARGEYLVRSVAGCGECHTPRTDAGDLDMSRWLGGVADRFDLAPDDPNAGQVPAPNLTPDPTGLGKRTEADIVYAMREGWSRGRALSPLMPSYVFHNMTDADAHAIVVYLRTVSPVHNSVPGRQPLPIAIDKPAPPVVESSIPHTTLAKTDPLFARAEHGRYLAGAIGFCMDCHTPWNLGRAAPLDMKLAFSGNRPFSARDWVVLPPARRVIYSTNLTPHGSGIKGWTPANVQSAITSGVDMFNARLCRPMPSGPFGSFGGMTADDALDIGYYLTSLPPIDSGNIPNCQ